MVAGGRCACCDGKEQAGGSAIERGDKLIPKLLLSCPLMACFTELIRWNQFEPKQTNLQERMKLKIHPCI
jgi:hypothetical protein